MIENNPYIKCPVIEGSNFIFRLVEEGDVNNLLECYSDKESVKIFNSDNCNSDFYFSTEEEMRNIVKFWLMEYSEDGYVRFSIVDKDNKKAIGTIEIFAKKDDYETYGKVGTLRLDLASSYETTDSISEIVGMISENFSEIFKINSVITKAIPLSEIRIKVLLSHGFKPLTGYNITKYDDYFIKIL